MRSSFSAAAFVLFAAGLAIGHEDKKPEKYVSKEGKYSVGFPGKPMVETKKAGGVDLHSAMVLEGMGAFSVFFADVQADAVKDSKPKDLLDRAEKGMIQNFKAKVTSSRDFEFGKEKYPAREFVAEKNANSLRFQIILANNRLYQVFVVGPKDMVTGKGADAFFKSFEITK